MRAGWSSIVTTAVLLAASNLFMTFAWYGHLKYLNHRIWLIAALASWGVALFEYMLQVPANRIGFGAGLSLAQLKIMQEAITLSVFVPFAVVFMQQPLKLDYLWAALCLVGAVYFISEREGRVVVKRLRHIAIEGPIGAGKSTLASLLAPPLGAELLLERPHENPFLKDFYVDGARYAFQTQLFFLFQRVELTRSLAQPGMFAPLIVSDFTLEKDRLFARLTLSDEEYRLYSMIHEQVAPKLPTPDLVIWLDGSMVVLRDRIRRRGGSMERRIEGDYLRAVADAYGAFFDANTDLPLLVVDIDRFDPLRKPADLQYLIERIAAFEGPRESLRAPPTIAG